jgi:hypothetical protein
LERVKVAKSARQLLEGGLPRDEISSGWLHIGSICLYGPSGAGVMAATVLDHLVALTVPTGDVSLDAATMEVDGSGSSQLWLFVTARLDERLTVSSSAVDVAATTSTHNRQKRRSSGRLVRGSSLKIWRRDRHNMHVLCGQESKNISVECTKMLAVADRNRPGGRRRTGDDSSRTAGRSIRGTDNCSPAQTRHG